MKFGTFWQTLVRKDSPVTSIEAAASIDTTRMEQIVYETIARFDQGCIQDEVLANLPQYPIPVLQRAFVRC